MDSDSEPMRGKTCLVTGATNGHGRALARALAELGARVWILGRNPRRCEAVQREIAESTGREPPVLLCDLSSRAQVERAAREFLATGEPLHCLINNAGLVRRIREESPDGIEMTLAVNYLAHFQLTLSLLRRIRESAPSRIINVASEAHRLARLDLSVEALAYRRGYWFMGAYNRSKLAQVYFAQELARRLAGTGITALAIDPGPVASGIADNETGLLAAVGQRVVKRFFPAPEIAARPALALATEPRFGEPAMSGAYFLKSERKQPRLDPRQPDLGARLWALSAELTGVDPAPLG